MSMRYIPTTEDEWVERSCWLCGENNFLDPLEEHHIFGGSNRKKSEKYGLTVHLCGKKCHRCGPKAVHVNRETAQMLHEYGQRKFMEETGCTINEFRLEFGRNYL